MGLGVDEDSVKAAPCSMWLGQEALLFLPEAAWRAQQFCAVQSGKALEDRGQSLMGGSSSGTGPLLKQPTKKARVSKWARHVAMRVVVSVC